MSGVKAAPAPWKLKGNTWIFVLSSLAKEANFPSGFAASYEADALASGGEFIGAPGLLQLVSYTESPVGPYDELIYMPGRWKYAGGKEGFRITRIYVSTKESVENGRRNWNIPSEYFQVFSNEQLADFSFKTAADGTTTFAVALPGTANPFFKASVKPIPLISAIPLPLNSSLLRSYFCLVQPPLPAGDNPEEVATHQWAALIPVMNGTSHVVRLTGGFEGGTVGDGHEYPALNPWSIGFQAEGIDLDFGVAEFYDSL